MYARSNLLNAHQSIYPDSLIIEKWLSYNMFIYWNVYKTCYRVDIMVLAIWLCCLHWPQILAVASLVAETYRGDSLHPVWAIYENKTAEMKHTGSYSSSINEMTGDVAH